MLELGLFLPMNKCTSCDYDSKETDELVEAWKEEVELWKEKVRFLKIENKKLKRQKETILLQMRGTISFINKSWTT